MRTYFFLNKQNPKALETTPIFENALLEIIAHNTIVLLVVLCLFWTSAWMIKNGLIRSKRVNLQKMPMKASRFAIWGIPAITALCIYLCWSNGRVDLSVREQLGMVMISGFIGTFTFLQWDAFGDKLRRIPDKKGKLRTPKRCRL